MTTCTTGKAVSDEDFDGADDGESKTSYKRARKIAVIRKKSSYSSD